MDQKEHAHDARDVVSTAYQRPLSKRWRPREAPVFPGKLYDLVIVISCVLLGVGLFFGILALIGAFCISLLLFFLWTRRKRKT